MNLPSVGKMIRVKHPIYNFDIWVEIDRHRMSIDNEPVIDCIWYTERVSPVPIVVPTSHAKKTINAVEIGRVLSTRGRYREITFEDQDGYADKKQFLAY